MAGPGPLVEGAAVIGKGGGGGGGKGKGASTKGKGPAAAAAAGNAPPRCFGFPRPPIRPPFVGGPAGVHARTRARVRVCIYVRACVRSYFMQPCMPQFFGVEPEAENGKE